MNCLNNSLVDDRGGARVKAEMGVGAQKTARKGVGILLPLVKALGGPSVNSSSPLGGGLQRRLWQVQGPVIAWLKSEIFFFFQAG